MDLAGIEMFLSIVSTKSISKTADDLFLSQSTVNGLTFTITLTECDD